MISEIDLPQQGRRSEIEIICAILKSSVNPIRLTHLIYSANINVQMFNKKVPNLIKRGLLEKLPIMARKHGRILSRNPKVVGYAYRTTEKGLLFVEKWNELNRLWRGDINIG